LAEDSIFFLADGDLGRRDTITFNARNITNSN
jgi:hypothetical protein